MSKIKRWSPSIYGEQVITLTFTVNYEASGDCYYDPGRTYGHPEDCYDAEGEAEVTDCKVTILDERGDEIDEESELGKRIMEQFNNDQVCEELMETTPEDF